MRFPDPLLRGTLVRRYKRFLADVVLESGPTVVAHCPNPGSMMGLDGPGLEVWLSPATAAKRKLRYTLELVCAGGSLVGVHTGRTNDLACEAIESGRITELSGYPTLRREVRYGRNSRVDLVLDAPGRPPCYVEVKSVTLRRDSRAHGAAEFPDAVTKRGAKHLAELAGMSRNGARAVMLYVVQRGDCDRFTIADDIDPDYGRAFEAARNAGVEAISYACAVGTERVELDRPLPVVV